ncbi:hypothetical protein ACFFS2_37885 [Streptomyces aurantiacus]|uniref:Sulfotransferase n=1 Tax=Streptomyces aurantiacus TaxID=47760 RepID=A0A7G1P9D3_9ACTN|nr:hypothetical protein [Streptomyces aurantiacus]BCL30504.1 hypothetical protein GCM10017557_53630 [Streptomyces aurantiacus]
MNSADPVVFCGMGGSGSTYLRHALARTGLTVHNKPDIVHHRHWVKRGRAAQRDEFSRRAGGFTMDTTGIAGIQHYFDRLAATPATSAVLSTWAEQQLLRYTTRRRVVFLLREPAAAYRSMCDPGRHGDIAEEYGGVDSWYAVFYAERWRKTAEEYLALRAAGWDVSLWSYENLPDHARRDGYGEMVTQWRLSAPRLRPTLRDETIDLIRTCTREVREALDVPEW